MPDDKPLAVQDMPDTKQPDQECSPELTFDPGEIAPHWASPFPNAELTEDEQKHLKMLCDMIGRYDVAARRQEVEEAWQSRLFDRGRQYLYPRRGGGWIYIPYATDYQLSGRSGSTWYGNETNIYATYGEIITAALTRDIPGVRFQAQNPSNDADLTAATAASQYAKVFARNNDLLNFQQQLTYYLRTDGRALIVTDHVKSAEWFGRADLEPVAPAVPETEQEQPPVAYAVRHGETPENRDEHLRPQDADITEKGQRQIERAAEWLKTKNAALIVSSPLPRATESAELLSVKLGMPVEIDDRLAALDTGATADNEPEREDIEEAFEERPDEPLTGAQESPEKFQQRVEQSIMEWLSKGQPVIFVVHDSVISQIYKMFEGDDIPPSSTTEPGWVVGISQNQDQTFRPQVVFPVTPPEIAVGEQRGIPRGQEVVSVYGKLEHKLPFSASCLKESLWAQVSYEVDLAAAKSMFPEKADSIKPGSSTSGENELDKIARVNVTLALQAAYVTGDSMVRDCTIQRNWLRPGYFMACEDKEVREALFNKFPDGAHVVQAGDCFIFARNESMDDHLTEVQAFPGSGRNRNALCTKLLSVQKRVNNWIDLLDQIFIRCIALRYLPSGIFDVQALNNQPLTIGGFLPYNPDQLPPGMALQPMLAMDVVPTHQPEMPNFIRFFINELPQLLVHALPSLFGSESNTDSWRGAMLQRDQALESNSTPWHAIQVATASYFKQAVQLAARCRQDAIEGYDSTNTKIRVELANLKGNILAYPESDANFPESWIQRQSRFTQLLMDATTNQFIAGFLSTIRNRMAVLDAVGLEGLSDPDAEGYEKQMGEFELLLVQPPVPNPAYQQIKAQLDEAVRVIQGAQAVGTPAAPQDIQQVAQLEQQLQSTPQLMSSVQIRDTDNHAAEAECCLAKINSPEGRKLANGSVEEQQAFANLTLHYEEHKAKMPPPAAAPGLPKGVTMNLKDAPPDAQAKGLQNVGLETSGQDVTQTREFQAELKKATHPMGPPVPGIQ